MVDLDRIGVRGGAAVLLFATGLLLAAAPSRAELDATSRGKVVRADLVRAYEECTAPNDFQPAFSTDACAPARLVSSPEQNGGCEFGPAGRGSLVIRARGSKADPELEMVVDLRDVRCGSPAVPLEGDLVAQAAMRYSSSETCTGGGDCTAAETLFGFLFTCGPASGRPAGRCRATHRFAPNQFETKVPKSSVGSIELRSMEVLDLNGNLFLVPGIRFP